MPTRRAALLLLIKLRRGKKASAENKEDDKSSSLLVMGLNPICQVDWGMQKTNWLLCTFKLANIVCTFSNGL